MGGGGADTCSEMGQQILIVISAENLSVPSGHYPEQMLTGIVLEVSDMAKSKHLFFSEHCRHWFFRGQLVIDGVEYSETLFKMIMATQHHTNNNNIIKFSDNSR